MIKNNIKYKYDYALQNNNPIKILMFFEFGRIEYIQNINLKFVIYLFYEW